jgi:hypothetical protein
MTRSELISHILFVAKAQESKMNRTGANAVLDIFLKSKRLQDVDGRLEYSTSTATMATSHNDGEDLDQPDHQGLEVEKKREKYEEVSEQSGIPNLHINIQIHISADSSPDQIDQIFASMAKHLKGFGKLSNE